jgi:hypothetical protein
VGLVKMDFAGVYFLIQEPTALKFYVPQNVFMGNVIMALVDVLRAGVDKFVKFQPVIILITVPIMVNA